MLGQIQQPAQRDSEFHESLLNDSIARFLLRHHKWPQFKLFLLTVGSTIASLIVIQSTRHIVDNAIPNKNAIVLLQIAAVAVAALAVKLVSSYSIRVTSARIQNLFITDIRDQLVAHALNIANPSQLRTATGSLHDRIVSDVYRFINGAEEILIKPLIGSTTILIYAGYLISIDIYLVPTILTLVPALIATPWINRRISEKRRGIVTEQEHYAADLQETIYAVEDIQNHGTINVERKRLGKVQETLAGWFASEAADLASLDLLSNGAVEVALVGVYVLGGYYAIEGELSLGTLIAFVAALRSFCYAFADLLDYPPLYRNARDRFEEVKSILRLPTNDLAAERDLSADEATRNQASYKVNNVSVVTDSERVLLHEVSIDVPPSQHVAIVGRSGSGKSTLLNLLAARVNPTQGSVRLCEEDLAEMPRRFRISTIGYARQVPFVFCSSIRYNILYRAMGLADNGTNLHLEDKNLIEACGWVNLDKDMLELGLDMIIRQAPSWAPDIAASRSEFADVTAGRIAPTSYIEGATVLENLTYRPWNPHESPLEPGHISALAARIAQCDAALLKDLLALGRSIASRYFDIMRREDDGQATKPGGVGTIGGAERAAVRHIMTDTGDMHDSAALQLAFAATDAIGDDLSTRIVGVRPALREGLTFPPELPFSDQWHSGLTVLENMIGIRVPNSQDRQREELKARLLHFIRSHNWNERVLALALDYPLTEEGLNLSGGQREKISIARVLVTQPRVLLLDEITASLDRASAEVVQHVLRDLFGSTTIIAVTHDLETARFYDRILVMCDGRIVADMRTEDNPEKAIEAARTLLDAA